MTILPDSNDVEDAGGGGGRGGQEPSSVVTTARDCTHGDKPSLEEGRAKVLGVARPITAAFAGGRSSSVSRHSEEPFLFLDCCRECPSCFVLRCFWRPITVLYFLSHKVHSLEEESSESLLISLWACWI